MRSSKVLALALMLSSVPICGVQAGADTPPLAQETKAEKDARMKWWREARFGLFIHWGVYSVPAGFWKGQPVDTAGEWIMHNGRIPVADYARFASQFNPVKFNAEEWVMLAKNAGMKYIVITSKHHDGFAMFGSKASTYNIVDATPFHRDPLKELAAACQKHGIKLGFYYSQAQDWHHPGGLRTTVTGIRPRTAAWMTISRRLPCPRFVRFFPVMDRSPSSGGIPRPT